MKINRIKINRFRSIYETDQELNDFNVLVGQNNHGKTNFFEAINWFFNGYNRGETVDDIRHCDAGADAVEVEITFTGLQAGIEGINSAPKKTAMQRLFPDADEFVVRRSSTNEGGKRRELWDPQAEEWKNPMGADGTWGDLLPTLEYVHTKVRLSDVGGYKKASPISEMLSGVLAAIVETNPQYLEFKSKFEELFGHDESEVRVRLNEIGDKVQVYLQKQFPDGTTVRFDVQNPVFEDLLKNFGTEVDDGVVTSAEEKGDGMQRAIMLSIIQVYADYRRDNELAKKFIFLIDEAELHLHPTAQRALKKALQDISGQGEQVLVNTHSSVLVTDHSTDQQLFQVHKQDGKTTLDPIGESAKQKVVFQLLGGSPADLLLPRNFMIVEGRSDCTFLEEIIARFYPEQAAGIHVVFAGGDIDEQERTLHGVHKMLVPITTSANPIYKDRVVVLCDLPSETAHAQRKYEQFREGYPDLQESDQLFILPNHSIEEYYPEPWKKTAEQVAGMNGVKEKVNYAHEVGTSIDHAQLISHMPVIKEALDACFDRAFPAN